ncbi:hypothetical protein L1049_024453 [Liquidambar formosana]|uniref:Uncharacterized protein n=1 Tax=Liquidambar formosana TaxID=63359 RepID=A0AAP0X4L2_LIQFO
MSDKFADDSTPDNESEQLGYPSTPEHSSDDSKGSDSDRRGGRDEEEEEEGQVLCWTSSKTKQARVKFGTDLGKKKEKEKDPKPKKDDDEGVAGATVAGGSLGVK